MVPLIFVAKDEVASGHVGRAKELESEEEKIEKEISNHFQIIEEIENKNKKIIPIQIWNELLKLTTQSLGNGYNYNYKR